MQAQSEGVASLVMDVDDLRKKANRFQDSLDWDMIELQADLEQFKEQIRRRLLEVRETITTLEIEQQISKSSYGCVMGSCV